MRVLSKTQKSILQQYGITYAHCELRLVRGNAMRYASASRSARGAICAAVLASELADTAGLEYRKEINK